MAFYVDLDLKRKLWFWQRWFYRGDGTEAKPFISMNEAARAIERMSYEEIQKHVVQERKESEHALHVGPSFIAPGRGEA